MATSLVFTEPEEDVPNFVLKSKDGREVTVTAVEIITAATASPPDAKKAPNSPDLMVSAVKLYLLNTHHIHVSEMMALNIFEEAENIYGRIKKNCTKTVDSDDSVSTTEPLPETKDT